MSLFCCNGNRSCVALSAIVSAVLGVVAAFLRITAAITVTPAFLWVVLGIATGALGVTLLVSPCLEGGRCVCAALNALLIGILGAAVTSILLLGVTFAATSVLGAVIVGILVFSLFLIFTAATCLIRCITNCEC